MRPDLLKHISTKCSRKKQIVTFLPIVQVFQADEIERKNPDFIGRSKRSQEYMSHVKRQLNRYKAREMTVHPDSKQYTEFHLV